MIFENSVYNSSHIYGHILYTVHMFMYCLQANRISVCKCFVHGKNCFITSTSSLRLTEKRPANLMHPWIMAWILQLHKRVFLRATRAARENYFTLQDAKEHESTWRRWQQTQLLQVQTISSQAKRSRAQNHQTSAGSFLQASASQRDQSPDGVLRHGRRCSVYLLSMLDPRDQNQGESNLHLPLHLTANNKQPSALKKSFFQTWQCR